METKKTIRKKCSVNGLKQLFRLVTIFRAGEALLPRIASILPDRYKERKRRTTETHQKNNDSYPLVCGLSYLL